MAGTFSHYWGIQRLRQRGGCIPIYTNGYFINLRIEVEYFLGNTYGTSLINYCTKAIIPITQYELLIFLFGKYNLKWFCYQK